MQPSGSVEQHKVVAVLFGVLHSRPGNINGVSLTHLENGNIKLCADGLKLLYGGGAVNITRGEQRALALTAHIRGELRPVRGLARALKPDEHHDRGRLRADIELLVLSAHEPAQLFIDDLYHHLRRTERLQHIRARGALGDGLGEVLDRLVADVRLQKRQTHLAHGVSHVRRGQPALAAELFKCDIQFFA